MRAFTKRSKRPKRLAIFAIAALGLFGFSNRAPADIIWGTATDMLTDNADVSAAGTYLDAASFYSSAQTVHTVTFNPLTSTDGQNYSDGSDISVFANNGTYGASTFAGGSTAYQNIVSQFGFGFYSNGSVTLSGLTDDHLYQVQVWASYEYSEGYTGTTFTGSTPVDLTPEDNQFATGTFLASGTSQSFDYDFDSQYDLVNAISVRDVSSVPEPASIGILGISSTMLLGRRRRKSAAIA